MRAPSRAMSGKSCASTCAATTRSTSRCSRAGRKMTIPARWIAFLAIASSSACVTAVPELFPPGEGEPVVPVWVVAHAWHTGVAVRRADVPAEMLPELEDFRDYDAVELGWGERDFYMDAGESAWLA